MELLIILALFVGLMAGFFGVGGGTLIVPVLLMAGYTIQEAIGISIIQMLFSSLWGSFLHAKAKKIDYSILKYIAVGAFLGGFLSPYIVLNTNEIFLEILFLIFISLALIKFFYTPVATDMFMENNKLLFLVSFIAALASGSVGIGGAIIMTPFLNAFMGYELKKATAISLFFILFNAMAGSVSWVLSGVLLYKEGLLIGFISLIGVSAGIYLAERVSAKTFKNLLLVLYIWVFGYFMVRVFF